MDVLIRFKSCCSALLNIAAFRTSPNTLLNVKMLVRFSANTRMPALTTCLLFVAEISDGFDSLSGLLSDLRSAQDDAQQEVSRALKERDKLLSCLQNKDENDDRMQGGWVCGTFLTYRIPQLRELGMTWLAE